MKKQVLLLTISMVALVGGLFYSCSKDVLQPELILKKGMKTSTVENPLTWGEACAGKPVNFVFTGWNDKAEVQVQIETYLNSGEWVPLFNPGGQVSAPQNFDRTFSTAGDYHLRYKVGSGGFTNITLTVVDCGGCTENFTYEKTGDLTYKFTYIPGEDMSNATLVFTFAQGVVVSGLDGWTTNGITRQLTTNLTKCNTYSWEITFATPECNGRSGSSKLWQDFKVVPAGESDQAADYSKKGSLVNIVYNCPQ